MENALKLIGKVMELQLAGYPFTFSSNCDNGKRCILIYWNKSGLINDKNTMSTLYRIDGHGDFLDEFFSYEHAVKFIDACVKGAA